MSSPGGWTSHTCHKREPIGQRERSNVLQETLTKRLPVYAPFV